MYKSSLGRCVVVIFSVVLRLGCFDVFLLATMILVVALPTEAKVLESCNQCKFEEVVKKEIKDNENLRDMYKKKADYWKDRIEKTKNDNPRKVYPDSQRENDLDEYMGGKDERAQSFAEERGYSGTVSLDTNPRTCDSDVIPKKDPKEEKARNEKIEKFKKTVKCKEVFDLSLRHEENHVKACMERKAVGRRLTSVILAEEEAQEHQKMIDELNKILDSIKKKCTPRYLNKVDTEKQKQKKHGAAKRVKKYNSSLK